MRLGVSQRHVSFVELGRTRPSKTLLRSWLQELDAPHSTINVVMNATGYSVVADEQTEATTRAPSVEPELAALLAAHEPFPAFVFTTDRHIIQMNQGARRMWRLIMPAYWARSERKAMPLDMIDALADPEGFLSTMRDAAAGGAALLALLCSEVWLRPALGPRVDSLAAALTKRYGAMRAAATRDSHGSVPVRSFCFDLAGGPITVVAAQSVIGLPQDLTLSSPRLEIWMPADEGTRQRLVRAAKSPTVSSDK
ncbi:MAG: hypothetical protein OJF60_000425 [Burkholderiaceae bacterium]|nr:MAG: hypothetical protein OJF60_000425 [Burkholderiaceae bacterium]